MCYVLKSFFKQIIINWKYVRTYIETTMFNSVAIFLSEAVFLEHNLANVFIYLMNQFYSMMWQFLSKKIIIIISFILTFKIEVEKSNLYFSPCAFHQCRLKLVEWHISKSFSWLFTFLKILTWPYITVQQTRLSQKPRHYSTRSTTNFRSQDVWAYAFELF